MDIKYLYSYLQNIEDDDEKLELIPNIYEQFKESSIMNLMPCMKLFQDEESAATFFSTALQYFTLTHTNDNYIDILQSFSQDYRYNVFSSCNGNYIIPHDYKTLLNLLSMMDNDEDKVKVIGYYSDIHINDQLAFCEFLAERFSSFSEFKKACGKLQISDLISGNFQNLFIKKNYRIIINNTKMPYVRIGDRRVFTIDNTRFTIKNSDGKIRVYIEDDLVLDSSGEYHYAKIEY